LSEHEALGVFKNMLHGLRDLMKNGIIHRDIKPANILLHEGVFKLTDFGFAKQVQSYTDEVMKSLVGTPL
jgi:serine/threonine-protein kinase ULK/ATG1